MEENVGPAVPEQPSPPPLSEWFGIWIQAVTRPGEKTYVEIARRADVKTAYVWLLLAFLMPLVIGMMVGGVFLLVFGVMGGFSDVDLDAGGIALIIGLVVCVVLGYLIFEIAMFSGMTALSNAIAKAFGGVGDFRRLVYCFAAYGFPIRIALLVMGCLAFIPGAGYVLGQINLALSFYMIVLNVIAIKAVHQIETWQAAVPSLVTVTLMLVLVCGLMFGWVVLLISVALFSQ